MTTIYLKYPLHPITINLIGVGGTGSLVLPRLARLDYALKLLDHPGLMVFAYDDDIVEEFNIGRQNFSVSDLGKNKAICITEKCNLSFGLLWEAIPKKYDVDESSNGNINIICVDNVKFREEYYKKERKDDLGTPYEKNYFTIDSGNGKNFGQVIVSSRVFEGYKNPFQIFPDIKNQDDEFHQGIKGCSYEDSLEKQDLFINDRAAVEVCDILWKLLKGEKLNINGVIFNQEKMKTLPIKLL